MDSQARDNAIASIPRVADGSFTAAKSVDQGGGLDLTLVTSPFGAEVGRWLDRCRCVNSDHRMRRLRETSTGQEGYLPQPVPEVSGLKTLLETGQAFE